ncbi:MAG: hypothetical protein IPK88_00510 [Saprospiraceae bacterium]|nr:hypothetical protein [Candidatus Defluviibacterium haderslevense]
MRINKIIEYSDIFDNYEQIDINELLKTIPSRFILEFTTFNEANLFTKESDFGFQLMILNKLSRSFEDQLINKINKLFSEFKNNEYEIILLNHISNLELVQFALKFNIPGDRLELTGMEELNLFKACLYYNQKHTTNQLKNLPPEGTELNEFAKFYVQSQLAQLTLNQSVNIITEMYKSISLFKFLSNNDLFKELYLKFIEFYHIENWQQYLKNIINIFISGYVSGKSFSHKIILRDDHPQKEWLLTLVINGKTIEDKKDFKTFREYPIYQLNNDAFLILNYNFFTEKLYNGIQFAIIKPAKEFKLSILGQKIDSFPKLKSLYSEYFSEAELFRNLKNYCFEKFNWIKYFDPDLKNLRLKSLPDLLMFNGNYVFVFEFKDKIITADSLHSYDYSIIESELYKKLVEDDEGDKVGVSQLVNIIEDISDGRYVFLNKKIKKLKIYPILVYTDLALETNGINYLLNLEFKKKISLLNLNVSNISDLTLINLDTFIMYQDYFHNKKLKLNDLIDLFNRYLLSNDRDENLLRKHSRRISVIDDYIKLFFKNNNILLNQYPKFIYEELGTLRSEE